MRVFLLGLLLEAFGTTHGEMRPDLVDWDDPNAFELSHVTLKYDTNDERHLQTTPGRTYEPLRISFDTRILESRRSAELNDRIDSIINEILPETAAQWAAHLSVQRVQEAIVVRSSACNGAYTEYLEEPRSFVDTDIVILVGGDPDGLCSSTNLAYARPCSVDQNDRPVIGVIQFCMDLPLQDGYLVSRLPEYRPGVPLSDYYGRHTGATFRQDHLRVSLQMIALHEMTHILGQHALLFQFFRHEDGTPRTPRDGAGRLIPQVGRCGNGTATSSRLVSDNLVRVLPYDDDRVFRPYVGSKRVQTSVSSHFDCPTLAGARLQDDQLCIGSHWSEREFFGHLMGPAVSDATDHSLTLLTLALLEDSGWYQVDYRGGSQPGFGLAAGCEFVQQDCIVDSQLPSWVQNEFCADPLEFENDAIADDSLNHVLCDPFHNAWTICDLSRLRTDYLVERRYFADTRMVPFRFPLADQCPIPMVGLGLDCRREDDYHPFYVGERVGKGSKCINAYRLDGSTGQQQYRPACMEVTCDENNRTVQIGSGDNVRTCRFDGEEIPVPNQDGSIFVCPRLATLCPELRTCPHGCFARGKCDYGSSPPICRCFDASNSHPFCMPNTFLPPTKEPSQGPTETPTDKIGIPGTYSPTPFVPSDSSGGNMCFSGISWNGLLVMAWLLGVQRG